MWGSFTDKNPVIDKFMIHWYLHFRWEKSNGKQIHTYVVLVISTLNLNKDNEYDNKNTAPLYGSQHTAVMWHWVDSDINVGDNMCLFNRVHCMWGNSWKYSKEYEVGFWTCEITRRQCLM